VNLLALSVRQSAVWAQIAPFGAFHVREPALLQALFPCRRCFNIGLPCRPNAGWPAANTKNTDAQVNLTDPSKSETVIANSNRAPIARLLSGRPNACATTPQAA
jgi:hypothetical protein